MKAQYSKLLMLNRVFFCTICLICERGGEPSLPLHGVALNAIDSRVLLTYLGHPMGMSSVASRDISKEQTGLDWALVPFFT